MVWILAIIGIFHVVGIGWGLPASDGWDNDGVAPRDFLPGLGATFTPGHYYTYPPVHLALLALVTSPITIVGFLRAPSHGVTDVVLELIKVPYMTAIAYVARLVSCGMSLAIALFLGRIAQEIHAHAFGTDPSAERAKRVAWCTAAFAGANVSFAYYGHTTNLDVPYLFWGIWALLEFTRTIARDEPRRLRRAFAFAVLAVGTKDQAYAMFLLAIPIAFVIWGRWSALQEAALAVALAIGLFLVVDAVIFNPSGFIARVHFLTGPASQDFAEYARNWTGRLAIVIEFGRLFLFQYAPIVAPLIVVGFWLTVRGVRSRAQWALALLPLLVALSFTICFNWSALRTNARFFLPQALVFAIYGGRAVEAAVFCRHKALRYVIGAVGLFAYYKVATVPVSFLFDPRYDTEAWLREHVKPGETIETYGLNVYLPRFPEDAHVIRVGPEPLDKRNPIPGIEEVQAPYADAATRRARWIVLPGAWVWRFRITPNVLQMTGSTLSPGQQQLMATEKTTSEYFEDLLASRGAFGIAHVSGYEPLALFPIIDVHGTSAKWVWIYERKPGGQ
jgi:hypothetical protein